MTRKLKLLVPIGIIIFLAFLLRLYKLEELFYFSYDEAIPAFVGKRMFEAGHIPLIGGVTPFGLHLGPYFYWISAIFLFVGKFNPLIWGLASAALSMVTVALFFVVGKEFFNKKVGFIAAAIWAFSYLAIVYDKHFWALYWGPLIALITLLSLKKIIDKDYKYFYLLGITLAFAIHADLSNLIFSGLTLLTVLIFKMPIKKEAIIAAAFIALSFLPLLAFDLRHNFANTRPLINYFSQNQKQANNPQSFWENTLYFGRTATRIVYPFSQDEIVSNYTYCKEHIKERNAAVPVVFSAISLFLILGFALTKGRRARPLLLTLTFVSYFVGIHAFGTIFGSDVFEHYLSGLLPVFVFIFAWIISLLPKKLWIAVLIIFISLNLYKLTITKNSYGLNYKRQAIEFVKNETNGEPFSLESISTCWKYSGYRYLFSAYGADPVKSYADPNLSHLYTAQVAQMHPETVVAFVTHDYIPETEDFYNKYALYKLHEEDTMLFRSIEVIIMNNKSGWFGKNEEQY